MAIPDSIKQQKPTSFGPCKIRRVNGHYYVYEVTSRWNREKKRADKIDGHCLGKITAADGFLPNRYALTLAAEATPQDKESVRITVRNYGAYETLQQLSPWISEELRRFFPSDFRLIRTLALLHLVDGIGPQLTRPIFLDSYMSEVCPDLPVSETKVRQFVAGLGMRTNVIEDFMRSSILPGMQLVFDGTHFFADFQDSLSRKGYNPVRKTSRQIRLLYIFDKTSHRPQFYQVLSGAAVDKTAFLDVIQASGCSHCIVIGDKGFYSKRNVSVLMDSPLNIEFILPLQVNTTLVPQSFYDDTSMSKFQGVFIYEGRPVYYHKAKTGNKGNFIYTFYDLKRRADQEASFVSKADEGWDQDSFTALHTISSRYGYFSYISNIDTAPQTIYLDYKERGDIEQCFDYLKNILHAAPAYAHTDESLRGWAFLNHISLLYFYGLLNALRETSFRDRYSPRDVILLTRNIYALRIGQESSRVSHIQKRTQEILTELDVDLQNSIGDQFFTEKSGG